MTLFVRRALEGTIHGVDLGRESTVGHLRREANVPQVESLSFQGVYLDDDNDALADLCITPESVIDQSTRIPPQMILKRKKRQELVDKLMSCEEEWDDESMRNEHSSPTYNAWLNAEKALEDFDME